MNITFLRRLSAQNCGGFIIILISILLFSPVICRSISSYEEYVKQRVLFFQHDEELSINAAWVLTPEETVVDHLLQTLKETDQQLDPVPVQFNFVSMRDAIDNSALHGFIQTIPKGSLLHSHDVSSQDMHLFIEMSYLDGCLYNIDDSSDSYGSLSFRPGEHFVSIDTVRNSYPGGVDAFDQALYLNFTILPYEDLPDTTGDYVWEQFQAIFGRLHDMYQYVPVFREYYRRIFSKLLDDGITRWEMRTSLEPVYDGEKSYSQEDSLRMILEELEAWRQQPGLNEEEQEARNVFSFGLIMQGNRAGTVEDVNAALEAAYALRAVYPGYVLGFDLVGHEDPGKTLRYWAPVLMYAQESLMQKYNTTQPMPFFFHAGESNRVSVQDNLVDAVLLNTSRIGHGFGVQGYPSLWPLLNQKRVLIESCPISNQVLGMVVDQRNHPVGQMLQHVQLPTSDHRGFGRGRGHSYGSGSDSVAQEKEKEEEEEEKERWQLDPAWFDMVRHDPRVLEVTADNVFRPSLTVSISNDDPGFWGIDAVVSYDWYVAVLGWDLSLAGIKQLAVDSIVRSGASVSVRTQALLQWNKSWQAWVKRTLALAAAAAEDTSK